MKEEDKVVTKPEEETKPDLSPAEDKPTADANVSDADKAAEDE